MERDNLERPTRRWEDNINMHVQDAGWSSMNWTALAQDTDRWWVRVNAVMNLRVP
jgi:hypothetical protein